MLASFLPDALQPAHLIQPFSERFFTVKAAAKIAENIEIITRFKLRLHQLLHSDNAAVGVVAILVKIVTFKLGRRRQYDIGESTGRRPLIVDGDNGFQLTPALNNTVDLLVTMERVGPGKNAHLQRWQLDGFTVPVDALARLQNRIDKTRDRDSTAVALIIGAVMYRWNGCRTRKSAQDNAFTPWGARAVVVPAKAKSPAG